MVVVIQLVNFLALFQLLAGLCLLFFYDDILKYVVITKARKESWISFNNIRNSVQGEISREYLAKFNKLLDFEVTKEGKEISLPRFRGAVNNIGRFGFVFLICIMFIASHEKIDSNSYYYNYLWIFLADSFFICYAFILFRYREKQWIKKYWIFAFFSLLLIPVVVLTFNNPKSNEWNLWIIYLILLTFIVIPIAIVLIFEYDEHRCDAMCERLGELKSDILSYGAWVVEPYDLKKYGKLSQSVKKLFGPKADIEFASTEMNRYVSFQLEELLKDFKTTRYLFISPLIRYKNYIVDYKKNIKWETYLFLVFIGVFMLGICRILF